MSRHQRDASGQRQRNPPKAVRHFDTLSGGSKDITNTYGGKGSRVEGWSTEEWELDSTGQNGKEALSNRWGLFGAATRALPLTTERLVVQTLTKTRQEDPWGLAFRDQLLPMSRRWLPSALYRATVESPIFGVPGLVTYVQARAAWVDGHIDRAVEEGCTQIVILGPGFESKSLLMGVKYPWVKFFEVDAPEIIAKKKKMINGMMAKPPGPIPEIMPCLIPLDWSNGSALISNLTANGFNPEMKCVCVMEGLMPHLTHSQAMELLADVAALSAPASIVLWDFLHIDAFDRTNTLHSGFKSLSSAMRNKGEPFRSGQPATFSELTKLAMPMNLRVIQHLGPKDISKRAFYWSQMLSEESNNISDGTNIEHSWCDLTKSSEHGCRIVVKGHQEDSASGKGSLVECIHSTRMQKSKNHPEVPSFYSFVAAAKINPRLQLKSMVNNKSPAKFYPQQNRSLMQHSAIRGNEDSFDEDIFHRLGDCFVALKSIKNFFLCPNQSRVSRNSTLSDGSMESSFGKGSTQAHKAPSDWSLSAPRQELAAHGNALVPPADISGHSLPYLKKDSFTYHSPLDHAISLPSGFNVENKLPEQKSSMARNHAFIEELGNSKGLGTNFL